MADYTLKEWQQKLIRFIEVELPAEEEKELTKVGYIAEGEIKQQMTDDNVVDTGRLRASITTQLETSNSVLVGTNVEYAEAVNNGHTQKQRFLPAKYLDTPAGRKYIDPKNNKGIMLHYEFIMGRHYMEKGMQKADIKIQKELDRWLERMNKKIGD